MKANVRDRTREQSSRLQQLLILFYFLPHTKEQPAGNGHRFQHTLSGPVSWLSQACPYSQVNFINQIHSCLDLWSHVYMGPTVAQNTQPRLSKYSLRERGRKGEKINASPYLGRGVIFLPNRWGGSIFPFQMGLELLVWLVGILSLSQAQ